MRSLRRHPILRTDGLEAPVFEPSACGGFGRHTSPGELVAAATLHRVRIWAVVFGIAVAAVCLYWTFAYFRRRTRGR